MSPGNVSSSTRIFESIPIFAPQMNRAVLAAANVLRRQRPDALIRAFATGKVTPTDKKIISKASTHGGHASRVRRSSACTPAMRRELAPHLSLDRLHCDFTPVSALYCCCCGCSETVCQGHVRETQRREGHRGRTDRGLHAGGSARKQHRH